MDVSRFSVAMTGETNASLVAHLMRHDGQEDLCLAIYLPSTGHTRFTGLVTEVLLPNPGERTVHGTVSFNGTYVLRAASRAVALGGGVAIVHSHPQGTGWQGLSAFDRDAETSFAALAQEVTDLPLLGMTYGGNSGTWSARFWQHDAHRTNEQPCESVRVVGDHLQLSWNEQLMPAPEITPAQIRTASCWGQRTQADLARLRILIVGLGTLGHDVALRLAAAGVQQIGLLDFDTVNIWNLDRLLNVSFWDAWVARSKVEVAGRGVRSNATAANFNVDCIDASLCEPTSVQAVLDYDLVFGCIDDRPWPRSILNAIAYSDLIPVIDGGVHIDTFADTGAMRNATWRAHVLRPGRPCMSCNGQLELGSIQADRQGLWDDKSYLDGLVPSSRPQRQNVGVFAAGAAAALLAQFTSYVANPSGSGDPGPVRFSLSTHYLERVDAKSGKHCVVESSGVQGDQRCLATGSDQRASSEIDARHRRSQRLFLRLSRAAETVGVNLVVRLNRVAENLLRSQKGCG